MKPYSRCSIALLLAIVVVGGLGTAAQAASFTVTSTLDAPDATPGDGLCASSLGDCTLRAAIQEANALVGADTINLPAGVYRQTAGELVVTDDLTLTAASAIIRGNRKVRVMSIASGVTVALSDVWIQRGSASSGGGLFNDGTLALLNVTIDGNTAKGGTSFGFGGGVYNTGTATLTNVAFTRNVSSGTLGSFGGGLYNTGTATLTNVTFTGNRARSGCGGGFYNTGSVQLSNGSLLRNRATNSGGGGFSESGSVQLSNATFNDNRAGRLGGALFNYATLNLSNVTINRSRAFDGGALFTTYGTVTLTNVTLSNNHATDAGGGIYHHLIYNLGSVSAKNTILTANKPQNCADSPITSLGHNLDSGITCALAAAGDLTNTDPALGPLQNNGGVVLTRAPLSGSPIIDAGDNDGCPTTDACGASRPMDGNGDTVAVCDMGAYELQP